MPILEQTQEQHEIEREEELEDREWAAKQDNSREEKRRQHELNLARIKSAVPQRHKTIARIGVGVVKAPAITILAVLLPLLVLANKELPKPLVDFLEL